MSIKSKYKLMHSRKLITERYLIKRQKSEESNPNLIQFSDKIFRMKSKSKMQPQPVLES